MTETYCMKTKSWEDMMSKMMEGYKNLPIIRDNPRWQFADITYRFVSHHSSLKSLKIRSDRKFVDVKEEANYNHVNQAHDSLAAVSNKKSTVESLSLLRHQKYQCTVMVYQLILVHVVLQIIQNATDAVWIGSFKRGNLHLHHRLYFLYLCQNIPVPLLGGQTFKEETPVHM